MIQDNKYGAVFLTLNLLLYFTETLLRNFYKKNAHQSYQTVPVQTGCMYQAFDRGMPRENFTGLS